MIFGYDQHMLTALVIVTLLSMWACYQIADSRSADRVFWLIMGLLFGPFAIPFAFLSKPRPGPQDHPEA